MATYWENSCSFGLRYGIKYLIVSLVFSHLGFWSGNLFLIAPFPDLCLLVPFCEGGLLVWGGISYHMKTPLHIFRGHVTAVAYRDEVLRPIVAPTIQNNPLLQRFQHDNARESTTFLQQLNSLIAQTARHQNITNRISIEVPS